MSIIRRLKNAAHELHPFRICQEQIWQFACPATMQSLIASYQGTAAKDSTFTGADIRGV